MMIDKTTLNLKPHFNLADSVPILSIDDEGIIETAPGVYSKTYAIQDINFSIAKQEERGSIANKWGQVLKSVDPECGLQIMIYVHDADLKYLSEALMPETGDGRDDLRTDINRVTSTKILAGSNGIRRDIYLTLTAHASGSFKAEGDFARHERDLMAGIRGIPGCSAKALSSLERLNLIHDIYHGGKSSHKARSFSLENIYRMGVAAAELAQPESMAFKNDHFILGDKVGRAFNLVRLPSIVHDALLKDLTVMGYTMLLTINIKQIDPAKAHDLVRHQRVNAAAAMTDAMKKAAQAGYDAVLTNPDLQNNFNEANSLLSDLERRDQKLFETKWHMAVFSDDKATLDDQCKSLINKCRTRDIIFSPAVNLQENALIAAMPFGIDNTPGIRTLTTEVMGVLVPFSSQEMTMRGGIVMGTNKVTHNLITYDRFSGDAYNGFILGSTGSGKSFSAKTQIINTALAAGSDADVIIIDPQDEYGSVCRALGGQKIDIKSAGHHRINPMDISMAYDSNPVAAKDEFVQSMMTEILTYEPNATQRSAISIACSRCYEAWRQTGDDTCIPTLEDFHRNLAEYFSEDGNGTAAVLDLIKAVEYYIFSTTTLFQGATNVNINSNFVCYNIADLGEALQPLAMLVILDSIWNRMARNRKLNRRTYIYIDEIHLLFKKQKTAEFIQKIYKVARKFHAAPMGITQDVEDFLMTTEGRTVLNNTQYICLLKQSTQNAAALAELLHLSTRQLDFVTDTPPGEGLMCIAASSRYPGGVIPFENKFPQSSLMYKICQSSVKTDD